MRSRPSPRRRRHPAAADPRAHGRVLLAPARIPVQAPTARRHPHHLHLHLVRLRVIAPRLLHLLASRAEKGLTPLAPPMAAASDLETMPAWPRLRWQLLAICPRVHSQTCKRHLLRPAELVCCSAVPATRARPSRPPPVQQVPLQHHSSSRCSKCKTKGLLQLDKTDNNPVVWAAPSAGHPARARR